LRYTLASTVGCQAGSATGKAPVMSFWQRRWVNRTAPRGHRGGGDRELRELAVGERQHGRLYHGCVLHEMDVDKPSRSDRAPDRAVRFEARCKRAEAQASRQGLRTMLRCQ